MACQKKDKGLQSLVLFIMEQEMNECGCVC